ncbi:hypothetical protein KUCAC02_020715, partial [Chaenocephalus aceratus]
MTKCDIKNYLENIYNVPVGAVRTRIQFGLERSDSREFDVFIIFRWGRGSNKKRNHLNQKIKQPDYKVAYVQLSPEGLAAFEAVALTPVFE